jgi:hypothetical protein
LAVIQPSRCSALRHIIADKSILEPVIIDLLSQHGVGEAKFYLNGGWAKKITPMSLRWTESLR